MTYTNLQSAKFARTPRNRFGLEGIKTTFPVERKPLVNPGPAHSKCFNNHFWTFPFHHPLNSANAKGFEGFMIQFTTISLAHE